MVVLNLRSIYSRFRTPEEESEISKSAFLKLVGFLATCAVLTLVTKKNWALQLIEANKNKLESSVTTSNKEKIISPLNIETIIKEQDIFGDEKEFSKSDDVNHDKQISQENNSNTSTTADTAATTTESNDNKKEKETKKETKEENENKINSEHFVLSEDKIEDYSYCEANTLNENSYSSINDHELIALHIVTRHGDRTPTKFLPLGLEKDPWNCLGENNKIINPNNDVKFIEREMKFVPEGCSTNNYCFNNPFQSFYWPGNCTDGQLTEKGMMQLNNVGKRINDIYVKKLKFLSGDFKSDESKLVLRSTNIWRTHQSANALLSGMYEQANKFEINVMPMELETLLPLQKMCPLLKKLELELKHSKLYKQFLASLEIERKKIEDIIGGPRLGDHSDAIDYYVDIFQARQCHQFPPVCKKNKLKNQTECVTKEMIDKMMIHGNSEVRLFYRDHPLVYPQLARLRIGGFLMELKRNLLIKISNYFNLKFIEAEHLTLFNSDLKFFYYSAHDTSIAAILGALHSDDMNWPPYASNLIFELWVAKNKTIKDKEDILNQIKLRMIYNGKKLATSWCKLEECNLTTFLNYLDNSLNLVGGFEFYNHFNFSNTTVTSVASDVSSASSFPSLSIHLPSQDRSVLSPSSTKSISVNGSLASTTKPSTSTPLSHPLTTWDFLQECWIDSE
ncbi:phosphoglycerate mutase-like protein [Neoconidiobolus thromboides FSU 785]|nr:phosphoglycerate mutase-like protein [Neoconidiobolus thromboides FSU 785]